jgi:crotonobetainyl-CoA:carnitine CoA-transferase CaiB-like acyl-CoA transferase
MSGATSAAVDSSGVLHGVFVLDLSRVLAGPYATQVLADLGATVWKVEPPRGDDTRGWGPPFAEGPDGAPVESGYFLSTNRGKHSLAIDLKDPRGAELVRRLAGRADVLIENFKVGDLARYGLDPAVLREAFPRLVTCSITGFGGAGPRAREPGYDVALQALTGVMAMTGQPGEPPAKLGVAWIDVLTGLHAVVGVLAALRARDRTGVGAHLDIALWDVTLASLVNQAQATLLTKRAPERLGSGHPTIVPYQAFEAEDAPFVVACGNDRQFERLAGVLGEPELARDARFVTNAGRVRARDALVPLLAERFRARPRAHWIAGLVAAGVPATPVATLLEALADPQTSARNLVREVDHPEAGPLPMVASPFGSHAVPPTPPPLLGEHTGATLREVLGLSEPSVAALAAEGVIVTRAPHRAAGPAPDPHE